MTGPSVREVVADLAERSTDGFRASYVSGETGRPPGEVQKELIEMVDNGELTLQYQLRRPSDGAVLRRYTSSDVLPIGEEVETDDDDPFMVRKRDVVVAYVPTQQLVTDLLKEARTPKVPAQRRGPRRWASQMKTGSIGLPFSKGSTST